MQRKVLDIRRERARDIVIAWASGVVLTLLFLSWLFFLTSCVSAEPKPVDTPPAKPGLAWQNQAWDSVLIDALTDQMQKLDKAKDIEKFCPKYRLLSDESKTVVWAHIAVAIAKRESNFKPDTVYRESNGVDSIGLFQLSYGDRFCPKSKAQGDLKDPKVNIACAVKLMGYFVGLDAIVAAGGYTAYGAPPAKGLARYWSVIRVPDKKSKHYLEEIKAKSRLAPGCV